MPSTTHVRKSKPRLLTSVLCDCIDSSHPHHSMKRTYPNWYVAVCTHPLITRYRSLENSLKRSLSLWLSRAIWHSHVPRLKHRFSAWCNRGKTEESFLSTMPEVPIARRIVQHSWLHHDAFLWQRLIRMRRGKDVPLTESSYPFINLACGGECYWSKNTPTTMPFPLHICCLLLLIFGAHATSLSYSVPNNWFVRAVHANHMVMLCISISFFRIHNHL